jgi:uncharacterized membrane protein HdeD (DUF308 family)
MATSTRPAHSNGWGVPMTIGILLILGGAFALYAAVLTTLVSVIFVGGLLVAVGILEIVSAFRARHNGPFVAYLLTGLLSLVVGGLFLWHPIAGLASLTLLIAGYLFVSGLFRGITAIADRYPRWGWDVAYAIVAVVLGIYVVAQWPISALWVLGAVVAAEIIAHGIALVAASWVLRDLQHRGMRGLATAP